MRLALLIALSIAVGPSPTSAADPTRRPLPEFERVVIDPDFPGGYQVEVADVDGDGRPDLVGVGGGTCAWYRNPDWTKQSISGPERTPRIISSATADFDGDGKAEVAIAYEFGLDAPTKGVIVLARRRSATAWDFEPIAELGSVHRLRVGDVDGDGMPELVAAPIVGPTARKPTYDQAPAVPIVYRRGRAGGEWMAEPIVGRPVIHAIDVLDFDGDGRTDVLTADNLGVALHRREPGRPAWASIGLTDGSAGAAPKRGCSEIHVGKLADGSRFLATVDPWHGGEVAIHAKDHAGTFTRRSVIDATLGEGHALWVADVDGDGDDEVFAGDRGKASSVLAYDFDGTRWNRTVIDCEVAAQDLRGGDFDGDGRPDFAAIGGSTRNLVLYRPRPAR